MDRPSVSKRYLSPPEIVETYGVSLDTVYDLITSGELPAINVATAGSKLPRYRVDAAALEAFERSRAVTPAGQGGAA